MTEFLGKTSVRRAAIWLVLAISLTWLALYEFAATLWRIL
jgi:hypothetical protein